MRNFLAGTSVRVVLTFLFIVSLVVLGDIRTVKAEGALSVEGEWVITWSNYSDNEGGFTIVRQDGEYNVIPNNQAQLSDGKHGGGVGLYYGSPNQITTSKTYNFDEIAGLAGPNVPRSVIGELVGKVIYRHMLRLSEDGQSLEYVSDRFTFNYDQQSGHLLNYNILPYADKATLVRVSLPAGNVESRGEHAYAADCGPTVPNRTAPITTDLCPGNLVAMTYFCGGDTGCPYVCCPKGLPYLNHCDCKCYATTDFECGSHSVCQVQQRQ